MKRNLLVVLGIASILSASLGALGASAATCPDLEAVYRCKAAPGQQSVKDFDEYGDTHVKQTHDGGPVTYWLPYYEGVAPQNPNSTYLADGQDHITEEDLTHAGPGRVTVRTTCVDDKNLAVRVEVDMLGSQGAATPYIINEMRFTRSDSDTLVVTEKMNVPAQGESRDFGSICTKLN